MVSTVKDLTLDDELDPRVAEEGLMSEAGGSGYWVGWGGGVGFKMKPKKEAGAKSYRGCGM